MATPSPPESVSALVASEVLSPASPPDEADHSNWPVVIVYTRPQLVHLSKSPLVAPPQGMPDLKDWFGAELEQSHSKRESEPPTPNRERRFRREQDDGESSSRPSFRSATSQPSQMGNFKHQSLRAADRDDRDRDSSERLRNLSDKYDRDRLALPASGLRGKDRDAAPNISSRIGTGSTSTIASRRAEARDASKKKTGEVNEDWRSKGRDERSDRHDRPRSRARDQSRARKDTSPSRRERDRDDRDRRRADNEDDDSRRWRDDGKRDERLASRRQPRDKEKDDRKDDRWNALDDSRDTRTNKRNGREKRGHDDGKDHDDRERRDRDREQKQPAWMETYVPSASDDGAGISGAAVEGQLDGIQTWKKSVQEKEQKDKKDKGKVPTPTTEPTKAPTKESKLDEIQMFRMMMEKEQGSGEQQAKLPALFADPAVAELSRPTPSAVAPPAERRDFAPPAPGPATTPASNQPSLLSLLTVNDKPPTPHINGATSELPARSRFFPKPLPNAKMPDTQSDPAVLRSSSPRVSGHSNHPSGSRLQTFSHPPPVPLEPGQHLHSLHQPGSLHDHVEPHFTPFEEARLLQHQPPPPPGHEAIPLDLRNMLDRSFLPHNTDPSIATIGDGMRGGSRTAKYFDGRAKDHVARNTAGGLGPIQGRHDTANNRPIHPPNDRHVDDLFDMLGGSVQNQRVGHHVAGGHLSQLSPVGPQHFPHHMSEQQRLMLEQPPLQPAHRQPLLNEHLESFYDSRGDDRSFVPDGMVPGLRTAPPPRDRLYQEALDDQARYNNRIPSRNPDPLYPAGGFPPQSRNVHNIPLNQAQYRGPSPLLHGNGQRLPPVGLANLGGRPPHEPTQLLSLQNHQGGALQILGAAGPPQYNNLHGINGPVRGSTPGAQLGALPPHLNNHASHLDPRIVHHQQPPPQQQQHQLHQQQQQQQQQQLLAMVNSTNSISIRGAANNYGHQQSVGPAHAIRQHQSHQVHHGQLPPHLHSQQGLPQVHPQQQHGVGLNNGRGQGDPALIALLMGQQQ